MLARSVTYFCVDDATKLDAGLVAELREIIWEYGYRDFQLDVLGVDKNAMVEFISTGLLQSPFPVHLSRDNHGVNAFCQVARDDLLSSELNHEMWSLRHLVIGERCSVEAKNSLLKRVVESTVLQGCQMLSARVASGDRRAIIALQNAGFVLASGELTGVVLPCEIGDFSLNGVAVRDIEDGDVDSVAEIARRDHIHNRFVHDGCFGREDIGKLYANQIRRYKVGDGTRTLVAVDGAGVVLGFICLRCNRRFMEITGRRLATLDFIGVKRDLQARGVGDLLNRSALNELVREGVHAVTIRTLMDNFSALSVLRKLDWRITSSNLVFHRWVT